MHAMFFGSKFNIDISNWKPHNIDNFSEMFSGCESPKPYWYNSNWYEYSPEKRINITTTYEFEQLEEHLKNNNKKQTNRLKI